MYSKGAISFVTYQGFLHFHEDNSATKLNFSWVDNAGSKIQPIWSTFSVWSVNDGTWVGTHCNMEESLLRETEANLFESKKFKNH